jgi:hypothetical protein
MLRKIAIALAAASLLGAAAIPTDALAFGRGGRFPRRLWRRRLLSWFCWSRLCWPRLWARLSRACFGPGIGLGLSRETGLVIRAVEFAAQEQRM